MLLWDRRLRELEPMEDAGGLITKGEKYQMMASIYTKSLFTICRRSFSSISNENVWKSLGDKTIKYVPTALEEQTVQQERPWALAPDLYYKLYFSKNSDNNLIYIDWLENPEWNIKIALKSCTNRYQAEVTALLYSMIYAHYKKKLYVSLYSDNEIVVKVASGRFNAKLHKDFYNRIQRRMNADNDILRARITCLDANLTKVKSIVEPKTRADAFRQISEDDFLDEMGAFYMNNGVNRVFSYFLRKCSSVASSSSSKTVQTTGYAYKHRDGRQVAKYGIYFDEGDGRNRLEEIYGKQMTHIAAKLYAIIEAIKLADKDVDLTIKTDYDIKKWDYMKKWADRDFRKYGRPDEKMPNADLLQELYNIIEEREKRIDLVYTEPPAGEKNPVTKLIIEDMYKNSKPYFSTRSLEEVKDSDAEDSSISVDDYREWPTVYTSGVLISSSKGFLSAGYSTVWPENKVIAASHQRLAMMPVTLFRAEMCAIILALEQAERHKLQKVLVVTDSPHFLRHWRKGWKTNKGEDVSNKFLYNRIYDLVWNRRMIVRFRYEKADDSSIWQTVKDKCQQAIMLPLSSADKSDYDKTTEEITTRKCHLVSAGEQVCRVRFFKKGTPFTNGLIWDKVNSEEPKRFIPAPPGKAVDIFLAILKQAAEENEKFIILRTDSVKLIKKIESWMPVWKRSGWRNSRKNITNVEKWQEVDQLLQDIRVYWEIMDPPLPEDIDELEKLAPKKRRKRLTVKEEESSDVILSRAEGVL